MCVCVCVCVCVCACVCGGIRFSFCIQTCDRQEQTMVSITAPGSFCATQWPRNTHKHTHAQSLTHSLLRSIVLNAISSHLFMFNSFTHTHTHTRTLNGSCVNVLVSLLHTVWYMLFPWVFKSIWCHREIETAELQETCEPCTLPLSKWLSTAGHIVSNCTGQRLKRSLGVLCRGYRALRWGVNAAGEGGRNSLLLSQSCVGGYTGPLKRRQSREEEEVWAQTHTQVRPHGHTRMHSNSNTHRHFWRKRVDPNTAAVHLNKRRSPPPAEVV